MKDSVLEIGALKPITAVINSNIRGDYIISSISIRDRLVKNCVAAGIKRIIILLPKAPMSTAQEIKPYIEYADEKSSTVEHVTEAAQIKISEREHSIYLEDGFLTHTSLLNNFIISKARVLKNPSNQKNIFSKDDFTIQAATTYTEEALFDCNPFFILEMNDHNAHEARTRLFKWLSKESDGFISKTLNRPVSTIFSKFFAEYPIHPIYFTGVTGIFAALMTYVLITGGEAGMVWGCILFHITSVVDGIDGEIARAKFQASIKGGKLDTTIDMITNILFMGAMSYALWATYGNDYLTLGVYIVALAMLGVALMTMLMFFGPGGGDFDVLANIIKKRLEDKPRLLKIFNFSNYCLKRDFFAFLFAVLGVMGGAKYIPEFLIFGLLIWNLAIILNARSIVDLKEVPSEI